MNPEELMEAMSGIDADLLAEAMALPAGAKRRHGGVYLRFAAAAAAFLFVSAGVWFALRRLPEAGAPSVLNAVSEGTVFTSETAAEPAATGAQQEPTGADLPETGADDGTRTAEASTAAGGGEADGTSPSETKSPQEPAGTLPDPEASAAPHEAPTASRPPESPASQNPTAAPDAPAGSLLPALLRSLFGENVGSLFGETDGFSSILLFIREALSGGNAASGPPVTEEPSAAAPQTAFDAYIRAMLEKGSAMKNLPVVPQTERELEAVYGGSFLPSYFPGRSAPPPEISGETHGLRQPAGGDPIAFNAYLYWWTAPGGAQYSLTVAADADGEPLPQAVTREANAGTIGELTVYWRKRTVNGTEARDALVCRGNAVFLYTLTGPCSDEAFLQTVRSALGN